MKAGLFILGITLSLQVYSQFPAPPNFEYSYIYIKLDVEDVCAGVHLSGPTYCSKFSWDTPDTAATDATLIGYNVYYQSEGNPIPDIIKTLTDTIYEVELGIMGTVWVTALYSNPEGESEPSNQIQNLDLPIGLNTDKINPPVFAYYNAPLDIIEVKNVKNIQKMNLYAISGKLVVSKWNESEISMSGFQSGLYILEVLTAESNSIRFKIRK